MNADERKECAAVDGPRRRREVLYTIGSKPQREDSIQEHYFKKHPDTHIFLIGQEESTPPVAAKAILSPVQFPKGIKSVDLTVSFEPTKKPFPPNTKLYKVYVENKGKGTDTNIKIIIDFTPNNIFATKIYNEEKVKLVRGGKPGSTIAEFEIDKLLPNQVQDLAILVGGKTIKSINADSDNQQPILKIFSYELTFEPLVKIVGQKIGMSTDGVFFEFNLKNDGTRLLKHGEIHLEWYDQANKENKTNVIEFANIPPGGIKSSSTICKSKIKNGEYFYHNIKIMNIRYELEGAEFILEDDKKGPPADYYKVVE